MITVAHTSSRTALPGKFHDAAEWLHALGDIPLERIVMDPWPGTATEADLLRFVENDGRLVELIDGTLVEKPVGWIESLIATRLGKYLSNYIDQRRLGYLSGADGTLKMKSGRVRLPDLAFVSVEDLPGGKLPTVPIPLMPFRLAVEVISEGNTREEMRQKMREYFESGTRVAWLVYPAARSIEVYESPEIESPVLTLSVADTLDGGSALPGFSLSVAELFATLQ